MIMKWITCCIHSSFLIKISRCLWINFTVWQGVRAGDRILEVNGTDFHQMSHAEAVTLMRNAWNVIMKVQSASIYRQGSQGNQTITNRWHSGTVENWYMVILCHLAIYSNDFALYGKTNNMTSKTKVTIRGYNLLPFWVLSVLDEI